MTRLKWDETGERHYETGVDHGVLYPQAANGAYPEGYAWNGLISVTESPSGAEASPQYADNIKYINLVSPEEFGGTIEAFSSPAEFDQCDGSASPVAGVSVGQQNRKQFGLSYRTKVGNDTEGQDAAYKIHLVYGGLAAPSEKSYTTVNDSPEAMALSWEFSTTPVEVPGVDSNGKPFKPTATLIIDSRHVTPEQLEAVENLLYGPTSGTVKPKLPLPGDILALFAPAAPAGA